MPELPDVAAVEQYLQATGLHQAIDRTVVHDDGVLDGISSRQLHRALAGRELTSTARHGKFLFARTSGDNGAPVLVVHFGMSGDLTYEPADQPVPRFTRVELCFTNGSRLVVISQRMLGRVSVADDVPTYIRHQHLGPDALADSISGDWFCRTFGSRKGAIKSLLMNQSMIAGIGNVWADEILFHARIHPATPAAHLGEDGLRELFRVMRYVLRTGVDRHADPDELPDHYLLPRRRRDATCPICETPVETVALAGRTAFFCPACQAPP